MSFSLRRLLIVIAVFAVITILATQPVRMANKFSSLVKNREFEAAAGMVEARDSLFNPDWEKLDLVENPDFSMKIQIQPTSLKDLTTMKRYVKVTYFYQGHHEILYRAGLSRINEVSRSYTANKGLIHIPW